MLTLKFNSKYDCETAEDCKDKVYLITGGFTLSIYDAERFSTDVSYDEFVWSYKHDSTGGDNSLSDDELESVATFNYTHITGFYVGRGLDGRFHFSKDSGNGKKLQGLEMVSKIIKEIEESDGMVMFEDCLLKVSDVSKCELVEDTDENLKPFFEAMDQHAKEMHEAYLKHLEEEKKK